MAAKADGSLQACVGHRRLHALTKRNRAPLWRQDDLFDMLHGSNHFGSLDLTQVVTRSKVTRSRVTRSGSHSAMLSGPYGPRPCGVVCTT